VNYIEAPENLERTLGHKSIFLAGGITGCPDWQREMVGLLQDTDLVLLNPRRANFPIHDPDAAREQITWEQAHLWKADAILFWFPCETLCPITLYELGAWSLSNKSIFIGAHSDYARRQDIEIQTDLQRPGMEIVYSLEELSRQVIEWAE
jgi:hypothetical protein